jgi:hypothetical protein
MGCVYMKHRDRYAVSERRLPSTGTSEKGGRSPCQGVLLNARLPPSSALRVADHSICPPPAARVAQACPAARGGAVPVHLPRAAQRREFAALQRDFARRLGAGAARMRGNSAAGNVAAGAEGGHAGGGRVGKPEGI